MNNQETITQFYTCFSKGDAEGMVALYHPDIEFTDPAFGTLKGKAAGDMWRMLLGRAKGGVNIQFSEVSAEGNSGSARWIATYEFSQTKRKVVNDIRASFTFDSNGKIIKHVDKFDLWKWSGMALGPVGYLMGWLPPFQAKLRQKALGSLEAFQAFKNRKSQV